MYNYIWFISKILVSILNEISSSDFYTFLENKSCVKELRGIHAICIDLLLANFPENFKSMRVLENIKDYAV